MGNLTCRLITEPEKAIWNDFIAQSKWSDILQYWQWGDLKQTEGWKPERFAVYEDSQPVVLAQALIKKAPLLGNYLYIPHGPVFLDKIKLREGIAMLVNALKEYALAQKCFVIEIEPKLGSAVDANPLPQNIAHFADPEIKDIFLHAGFLQTNRNTQPKFKLYYDLDQDPEQLLQLMKKNTRYNVRLAEKKGVEVNEFQANDPAIDEKLEQFYALLKETQVRAKGYPIRSLKYFRRLFAEFKDSNSLSLFETRFAGDLIAINISQKTRFWSSSFYAASNRLHTDVKAPYLLRWKSILAAKQAGCKIYDFWGIIPGSEEHKGYSETKLSFGGSRIDTYGIWSLPLNRKKYLIWDKVLPVRSKLSGIFRRF